MHKGSILIGLVDGQGSYKVLELLFKLNKEGYKTKVLRTECSENNIPLKYLDDVFAEEGQIFDYGLIGPLPDEQSYNYDFNGEEIDPNQLKLDLLKYLDQEKSKIFRIDNFDNIDVLLKKISLEFKVSSLDKYSFLFTVGSFKEHLTNNHYIGVYERKGFIESLIEYTIKEGANVSIIASRNYQDRLAYFDDVVYVDDIDELNLVLDSRIFKYDIIVDAIRIPRFALRKDEKFKIEYQRYFAEFEEKYLPFTNEEIYSKNQIIISVQNGFLDNKEAIFYLFDNSGVDLVVLNEYADKKYNFKPFVKIINKDKSVDMLAYKDDNAFTKELVKLFIEKLNKQLLEE